ncbi:MAG TPA: ABC transporter permease [Acidimicrobiia bacterium]|jgi:ABC-2 type transport system permease protein|nr:ABC transporter permease [Acidimicrobiia bacterium]
MSWRRSWALIRHELKALADDPGSLVFLLIMPVLMMGLMKPLFGLSLQAEGYPGANGAEQAVPGMAAMFVTFTGSFAGFTFFREHGWKTWDRLRASQATTWDVMVGKLGPTLLIGVAQLAALFWLGVVLFDLVIAGSMLGLEMVAVTFALSMVSFGMAVTALSRTSLQLNTFVNLFGIIFAGVGGALVPLAVLPEWVQTTARFVPTYWAMDGFLGVILNGESALDVVGPTVMLVVFTTLFTVIAAVKFRFEESKVYVA